MSFTICLVILFIGLTREEPMHSQTVNIPPKVKILLLLNHTEATI